MKYLTGAGTLPQWRGLQQATIFVAGVVTLAAAPGAEHPWGAVFLGLLFLLYAAAGYPRG